MNHPQVDTCPARDCGPTEAGEAGQEEQHLLQQHDHVHQQQAGGQRQHHERYQGQCHLRGEDVLSNAEIR